jgi:tRNA threonylcarbamoyladenosine biosynthesis protein TsaE
LVRILGMSEVAATFSIDSGSSAETEALGASIARGLTGGELIVLSGELGAGKTVFVRGLARGLDMPAGIRVTSPTYVLQHAYRGGRLTLYHMDAYRIGGGAAEFEGSGLRECLDDMRAVVCLEWPERLADLQWPRDRILVQIEHVEMQQRRIAISGSGQRSHEILNSALGAHRR